MSDIRQKPGRSPGRPKGSKNKLGRSARDAIAAVFDELGGTTSLKAWVELSEENRTIFYSRIYPKLIPVQVGGPEDGPISHEITVHFV